ncbi:MAG: hypothetical protein ACOH1Y_11780 [Propionicimonas sp.]
MFLVFGLVALIFGAGAYFPAHQDSPGNRLRDAAAYAQQQCGIDDTAIERDPFYVGKDAVVRYLDVSSSHSAVVRVSAGHSPLLISCGK